MNPYLLIADGACSKNPGPGGYGTIVITPEDQVFEFGGSEKDTTNNRMELMGFYRGLQEIYKLWKSSGTSEPQKIQALLDSMYVIDGAKKFIWNWARNGWKTQSGDVKNQDLWEKVLKGLTLLKESKVDIEYVHVKGHSGHEGNERVDQISVAFAKEMQPELYSGPRSGYAVNLNSGKFAPCYLSYVNGELKRHATWPECEAFVKGRQGAKYKKVTNRLQEEETLKLWGVPSGAKK